MFKPIGALVQSPERLLSEQRHSPEQMAFATMMAARLFGQYPNAKAHDPETFTAGVTRLFMAYPREVVEYVVDPVTGIVGTRHKDWDGIPSPARIKSALDERAGFLARQNERRELESRQVAARRMEEEKRKRRPNLDELKEQYGQKYGLQTSLGEEAEEVRRRRHERIIEGNRLVMERELAGATLKSVYSPSPTLAKLIAAKRDTEAA